MKSKEDLFLLIKTMSKAEKRYFTLDAQRAGRQSSKYLELFQVIAGMDHYDDTPIKQGYKHLASDKAYLYNAILRSMRDYRSANSHSAKVKELIMDARYLYERGLYEQCETRLLAAKKLAAELDDKLSLIEINREERSLAWTMKKNLDLLAQQFAQEKNRHLAALTEELEYLDLSDQLTASFRKGDNLTDESKLEEWEKKLTGKKSRQSLSPKAYRYYVHTQALRSQLTGDRHALVAHYKEAVEWWNTHEKIKEDEFFRFVIDISNLLHAYRVNEDMRSMIDLVERLEKEKPANLNDQAMLFQRIAIYKSMYFINTGETFGVESFVRKVDKGISTYQVPAQIKLAVIFNVAILLFTNERFQECIEWCKKIIRGEKTEARVDIQKAVHLIWLVASFEAGDLDNTLRSLSRYFGNLSETGEDVELKLLDLFKRLWAATIEDQKALYGKISELLDIIGTGNNYLTSLGMGELLKNWLISRKENRRISDVFKNAAQK